MTGAPQGAHDGDHRQRPSSSRPAACHSGALGWFSLSGASDLSIVIPPKPPLVANEGRVQQRSGGWASSPLIVRPRRSTARGQVEGADDRPGASSGRRARYVRRAPAPPRGRVCSRRLGRVGFLCSGRDRQHNKKRAPNTTNCTGNTPPIGPPHQNRRVPAPSLHPGAPDKTPTHTSSPPPPHNSRVVAAYAPPGGRMARRRKHPRTTNTQTHPPNRRRRPLSVPRRLACVEIGRMVEHCGPSPYRRHDFSEVTVVQRHCNAAA